MAKKENAGHKKSMTPLLFKKIEKTEKVSQALTLELNYGTLFFSSSFSYLNF